MSERTIAAIATPRAVGGISVIRISGDESLSIADSLFHCISQDIKPSEMKGYTCAYGYIYDGESKIDDGIITVFRAPKSYTGEDVVEISCHGGIFITEKILRLILGKGAYPAGAGEFTKRGFINGKMTLTQAEAVMDIISADGDAYHKCAESLREGKLYKQIREISDGLVHILGDIAAWIDYPEEDIENVENDKLIGELNDIKNRISRLSHSYDYGKIIREGVDTAIVGKPNVGKSTLMNMLSGCERSIVTDIAGTTRDIVEETVRLGDVVLRLSDTAGIHSTDDVIEEIGVMRAEDKIRNAQLILAVFDGSVRTDDDDIRIIESCSGIKNKVAIINKTDLETNADIGLISEHFDKVVEMSAKNDDNADKLRNVISEMFLDDSGVYDNTIIANERQKQCIDNALMYVNEAIQTLESGMTLDAVEIVIEQAEYSLEELSGERVSDRVVSEVFSRFCVGK